MPMLGEIPPALEPAFTSLRSIFDQQNAITQAHAVIEAHELARDREAETDGVMDGVLSQVAPNLAAWNRAFPRPRLV
jgi:hypothetical protein